MFNVHEYDLCVEGTVYRVALRNSSYNNIHHTHSTLTKTNPSPNKIDEHDYIQDEMHRSQAIGIFSYEMNKLQRRKL
jgi:hypothetical protein